MFPENFRPIFLDQKMLDFDQAHTGVIRNNWSPNLELEVHQNHSKTDLWPLFQVYVRATSDNIESEPAQITVTCGEAVAGPKQCNAKQPEANLIQLGRNMQEIPLGKSSFVVLFVVLNSVFLVSWT